MKGLTLQEFVQLGSVFSVLCFKHFHLILNLSHFPTVSCYCVLLLFVCYIFLIGHAILFSTSFTAALGSKNKKKDLNYGIVGGTVAVCVAIALISFGQIANINTPLEDGSAYVWNADIPNLILAMKIWKPFSAIFAIVVFAGIYTTAVPLLYNPASRFAKEGTSRFKILTVVLAVVGLIVGLFLPFRTLVNVIYVLNGYVGAVLILFMIKKNITDFLAKRKKA